MKPISPDTIHHVINELVQQASLSEAMNELDQHQPEVLTYLMLTLDGHPTPAGMRACHLGWCVFRAFQRDAGGPLPKLSMAQLVQKAHLNEGLIEAAGKTSIGSFMSVMSLEMANQPVLLDFVRRCAADVLTDDHEQNRKLVKDVVAIFLAVKTVVDAFDSATDEVSLQPDRN